MKITILNGNPNADNVKFDNYLKELSDLLESSNHTVTILKLREMDIRYCLGCLHHLSSWDLRVPYSKKHMISLYH